ncbi:MAG: hypothetical protein DMF61_07925 [Blastocatellia bacterium AA13]|nr:MAG: hypothetical protein DMF61_07925 [Blastocatellia bacterium AA13]
MTKTKPIAAILTACLFPLMIAAQTRTTAAKPPNIEEIIHKFAAAESQNRLARNNYAFTQDVDIMTLGAADSITGRFRRTSDIVLDDRGARIEKITFFPPSTLREIQMTQEDFQDLAGVQPFALSLEELSKYQIDYLHKEKIDELDTYVFDVKPIKFIKGERYFQGRIYVDDRDLQIVKAVGQAVPEINNQKFPHFESYRQNIDERYWFPVYVYADDLLDFKKGPSVHLRMVVRYTNYKKFSGDIRIVDGGEAVPDEGAKPSKTKTDAGGDKKKNDSEKPPDKKKPELKTKPPQF